MHLQTLAITINQSLIGKVRLLLTMLHHNPQTFRSGDFFCGGRYRARTATTTAAKQEISLRRRVFFHWEIWYTRLNSTNRNLSGRGPSILLCKTVLSLKSPTGAFIAALRFANANLYIKETIDETVFMFALFKCRKSDKGRN